jgi:dTDP-glucose pyrophosphorylase/CBS domain-containing protein
MAKQLLQDITVKIDITIRQAMTTITKTGEKCLLVVDDGMRLLGTLSDGDLRRSILTGTDFNTSIENFYNRDPKVLMSGKYSKTEAEEILAKERIDLLPILDSEGNVIDYITWEKVFGSKLKKLSKTLKVPVVIMAGGRGSRMEPFTQILPKPLVPINEKPIIEHIIERFTELGCSEFHITVNYKGKLLKAYFEELQPKYRVKFVEEQEPLGTAGSLWSLQDCFDKPLFVTNCDIIVKADYNSIYEFHQKGEFDVTMVASVKEYIIPYGTCELNDKGHLSHINEKPKYDFLINTGLYVLNPEVLKLIPENKFFHITHLIEETKNKGFKVGVFPIDDDAWIDVGQWKEYRNALNKL